MTSPSKFHALPLEILLKISLELDTKSAASFSLVSKTCALAAEPAIWRHIDLNLPTDDEGALVRSYTQLFRHGRPRTWDMVRSVTADVSPTALYPLLQLLEYTSKGLKSLELSATDRYGDDGLSDYFDVGLLRYGRDILFSSLTHLRLSESVNNIAIIPYICSLTPALISLDATIASGPFTPKSDRLPIPKYNLGDTKLTQMRLILPEYLVYYFSDGDHSVLTDLVIVNSPQLRQLSILHDWENVEFYGDGEHEDDIFLKSLSSASVVQDLCWHGSWGRLLSWGPEPILPSVRRLLLLYRWSTPASELPILPFLEIICFDCQGTDFQSVMTPLPTLSPDLALDPEIAHWIRVNPSLRTIILARNIPGIDSLAVFDTLNRFELSGHVTATISSIRHDGNEILHIQYSVQVTSIPSRYVWSWNGKKKEHKKKPMELQQTLYVAGNRSGEKFGLTRSEPFLQEITDWEGCQVPLEILEKMRVVEGVSVEEWDKRGVEVGEAAWRVLMDWRECRFACKSLWPTHGSYHWWLQHILS